jgi:outer membrane protein assembly factor BamE (lipoprotein component of BamABCDE complex)
LHGAFLDKELVEQIRVGETTKEEVLDLIGSPSTHVLRYDQNEDKWLYLGRELQYTGFLGPKLIRQDLLLITFTDEKVQSLERLNEGHYKALEIYRNMTKVKGDSFGLWQQFLGNIGRFS